MTLLMLDANFLKTSSSDGLGVFTYDPANARCQLIRFIIPKHYHLFLMKNNHLKTLCAQLLPHNGKGFLESLQEVMQ